MGIAKLYGQKASGTNINGIIKDYYAYAGENISAGDLVEYINGIGGQTTGISEDTQLSSTAYTGYVISAVQLDENRVFIAHSSGSTSSPYLYGVVCTINGATITHGTDTVLVNSTYSGSAISALKLEDNKVFIAHSHNSSLELYGMICTINETTIIVGVNKNISTITVTGFTISAVKLEYNKIFIAHSAGSNKYLYGVVCTINGTTITAGTDTSISTNTYAGYAISTELLPNDRVFIAHSSNTSYYLNALVCTVSGTTFTYGSDVNLSSNSTCYAVATCVLDSDRVFVTQSWGSSNRYLYGRVCTISGASITSGTDVALVSAKYAGEKVSMELLPNGNIFIVHSYNTSYYLYGMVVTIDGTTITIIIDKALNTSTTNTGFGISTLLLNNGTIFIAHSYGSNYHLYAQIWGIDEANNIPTNNVTITEYETQVRKTTTPQFYGIAKTSGIGGDETGHEDLVSIYTL